MISQQEVSLITNWFKAFEGERIGSELVLPDDVLGNPTGEEIETLTMISLRKHKLILELDDRFLLTFSFLDSVWVAENCCLSFADFSQVVLDRQDFGGMVSDWTVSYHGHLSFRPKIPEKDFDRFRKALGMV